jgi:hypothetical protein
MAAVPLGTGLAGFGSDAQANTWEDAVRRFLLKCAAFCCLVLILGPSGCMTVLGLQSEFDSGYSDKDNKVFIGTRLNLSHLLTILGPLHLVDLFLCLVADTFALPYTMRYDPPAGASFTITPDGKVISHR